MENISQRIRRWRTPITIPTTNPIPIRTDTISTSIDYLKAMPLKLHQTGPVGPSSVRAFLADKGLLHLLIDGRRCANTNARPLGEGLLGKHRRGPTASSRKALILSGHTAHARAIDLRPRAGHVRKRPAGHGTHDHHCDKNSRDSDPHPERYGCLPSHLPFHANFFWT